LWALIGNPKLWQGREKRTPKHHTRDDVLCLNQDQVNFLLLLIHYFEKLKFNFLQLCTLLDYVLHEALLNGQEMLESRVSLILQCLPLSAVPQLVRHLAASFHSSEKAAVSRQLLLRLYLSVPVLVSIYVIQLF